MNRSGTLSALSALVLLAASSLSLAAETTDPAVRSDPEIAAEYRSEAVELRKKAESHRKLSKLYATRIPLKGSGNYKSVARHCDKLAAKYEAAAKDAEAVAESFWKQ